MKVVAIMPIKLHNERCPGKNTRLLGVKPLLQYELDALKETGLYKGLNTRGEDRWNHDKHCLSQFSICS